MSTDQPEDPYAKPPREPSGPAQPSAGQSPPGGLPGEQPPGQEPGQEPPGQQPPPGRQAYPPPYPSAPGGSPYDRPAYGGGGDPYASGSYGMGEPDPLAGMPPLANRGRRLAARIVDALVIGIPVYGLTGLIWNYDYNATGAVFSQSVIYAVVYLAYQVFMLTRYGQSLGKKLLRVRVGMLADGAKPTAPAALKRESVYSLVPIVPCCGEVFWVIEVLWCTWDKPYRQCLHDKAGQTVVVSVG
ncbi:RDD family protein [Actinacidiphila sp. bgisy167]|uniref:RDD family protein n=1 Tax=Actinacidiphila sp. bgisy167 TaxID=3413797 RepID=UPI003D7652AD